MLASHADQTIIASFDRLDLAAALLDGEGHVLESTACLRTLLRVDPELLKVFGVPNALAGLVAAVSGRSSAAQGSRVTGCHRSLVTTRSGRYLLRATGVGDAARARLCVVLISTGGATTAELPCSAQLIAAYRLTTREAEVALLLAEGASDRDVARGLNISPHTARKHTEHILHKLGINSRKALGWRILVNGVQST